MKKKMMGRDMLNKNQWRIGRKSEILFLHIEVVKPQFGYYGISKVVYYLDDS